MGGVASFNRNIINYSKRIKDFYSKVILLRMKEDERPFFTEDFKADEVITFHYSWKENQYFVQRRLNDLIGNKEGLVVTDNLLTINAIATFSNPKTVFHLIHDYYYVSQNVAAGNRVDIAIAHSSFFRDAVFAAAPDLFAERSLYIPYGVQQTETITKTAHKELQLVFLGRLEKEKGVLLLHDINDKLKAKNVNVTWAIIGKGSLKQKLLQQWAGNENVIFYEPSTTAEVYQLLEDTDIFVFPTTIEGTPVSIMEAIANGVVCITNDLPGGIRDIVKEGIGYRCKYQDTQEFADNILKLNADRNHLLEMQQNCSNLAKEKYDILHNADDYFEAFANYKTDRRAEKRSKPVFLKMDNPFFPNWLVIQYRKLRATF